MMSPMMFRPFATASSVAAMLALGVVLVAGQQDPAAPVFTTEQATAGRAAYAKNCASCHMPDLTGNVEIPPLAGTAFMGTWGTRSTKDLFDYMSAAMPYGAPSLSPESYTSILAYILQSNGAVAGADALSASTVVSIGSVTAPPTSPSP
jgi:mono/diheme cytochrome c family protein